MHPLADTFGVYNKRVTKRNDGNGLRALGAFPYNRL